MKVIVFDLGGTLMEYTGMPSAWVEYYRQGFEAINQKFNLNASESDIAKSVEMLKDFNPRVHYREKEYSPESIFSKVLEHWENHVSTEKCADTFFEGLHLKATIYPDSIPALEKLKSIGCRIAALTDLPTAMPDKFFKKDISALLEYFDLYVSSQNCGFRKPNCAGLQKIAAYFHVPITDLVFVGDEDKDRKTAVNAGCGFVRINRNEIIRGGICSLNELVTLLKSGRE